MDFDNSPPPIDAPRSCCTCSCCSLSWDRSLKRKFDQIATDAAGTGGDSSLSSLTIARVEIENECVALREALSSQQQTMQELCEELEEERNAAASAANEAMAMILRLQREKAEIQMEARQFRSYTDERMAHDQHQLLALEDLLYKKDQVIQSLVCELQACKHRLMSFGCSEAEAEGIIGGPVSFEGDELPQFDLPRFNYPSLRCNSNDGSGDLPDHGSDAPLDLDKYPFEDEPVGEEYHSTKSFIEKTVVGQSPLRARRFHSESCGSLLEMGRETGEEDFRPVKMDNASDVGDDTIDRVYTIDSVQGVPCSGHSKMNGWTQVDDVTCPKESLGRVDVEHADIKKLYARLQLLEADRESMRQEIMSMHTSKAQVVLMREMSQLLCKRIAMEKRVTVKKMPVAWSFSFMALLKWIASFVYWRRKSRRSKYMIESTSSNVGLLLLLDKSPYMMRRWKCLPKSAIS